MSSHPAISRKRVAVVTGAASGIGRAATERFAAAGMKIVLVDVARDELRSTAAALDRQTEVLPAVCDVGDPAALQALADQVCDRFDDVRCS